MRRYSLFAGFALLTLVSAAAASAPRWSADIGAPARVPPAIADVTGDGQPEVILCARFIGAVTALTRDGAVLWTWRSPQEISGGPAAVGPNRDRRAKVAVADRSGYLTCLGGDGKPLWQRRLASGVHYSSPVFADLTQDGRLETIVGTSRGEVVCLSEAGRVIWSFHLPAGEWRVWSMIASSLACGDVDGDGQLEVLVPSQATALYCLSSSGSVKWKFPSPDRCDSDPVIADLEGDGAAEVIAGWNDRHLRCLDGRTGAERWRLAVPGDSAGLAVADLDGDGRLEVIAAVGGSVIAADASGQQLWRRDGVPATAAPVIGDFDGDGRPDTIVPCSDGRVLAISADGAATASVPVPGGAAGAAFADLDGDGKADLITVALGGIVTCWPGAGAALPGPQWRGGAALTGAVAPTDAPVAMRLLSWGTRTHGRNLAYLELKNSAASPVTADLDAEITGPTGSRARTGGPISLGPGAVRLVEIPYELDRTGRYRLSARVGSTTLQEAAVLVAYQADLRQAQSDVGWLRSAYGRRKDLDAIASGLRRLEAVPPARRPDEWREFEELRRGLDALLAEEGLRPLSPLVKRLSPWEPGWSAPVMSGREFWHVVMYQPNKWKEYGIADLPFIADAALRVEATGDAFARVFAPDSPVRADLLASGKPFYVLNGYFAPTQRVDETTFRNFLGDFGDRFWGFSAHEWQNGAARSWSRPGLRPQTRAEAADMLRAHLKQIMDLDYGYLYAGEGYRLEQHLGCAGGVMFPYAEVGENIPMTDLQIAFTRGAARQYGRPWGVYLSAWYRGGVTTYNLAQVGDLSAEGNSFSGTYAGHSASLMERQYYLGYLSGATTVHHESDSFADSIFVTRRPDGQAYRLSEFGDAAARWFEMTRAHPDRGIPATPIALMLDRDNGFCPAEDPIWKVFPKEAPDYGLDELANTLFPWDYSTNDEKGFMVSSPYGDVFDAVTQEAASDALDKYAVVVAMGPVTFDALAAERLRRFVAGGGVAVLNIENVREAFGPEFTGLQAGGGLAYATDARCLLDGRTWACDLFRYQPVDLHGAQVVIATRRGAPLVVRHAFGQGAVVVTLVPWMLNANNRAVPFLPHLLRHLRSGLLPVYVTGGVGYTVARSRSGWVVGLFNNQGVVKRPGAPPETDPAAARRAGVLFSGRPAAVEEWVAGETIESRQSGDSWTGQLEVPPGDVRIVEIKLR